MKHMKKLLTVLLAAAMALSLAACGGESATAEDLQAQAEEVNLYDMNNAVMENLAAANETYAGKTVQVSGFIREIAADHCVFAVSPHVQFSLHVYLDQETLAGLRKDTKVTVVGTLGEVVDASSGLIFDYYMDLTPAAFVSDQSTLTSEVIRFSAINDRPFCQVGATGVFLPQKVLDQLSVGQTVTVSGLLTFNDTLFFGSSSDMAPPQYFMEDAVLEDPAL